MMLPVVVVWWADLAMVGLQQDPEALQLVARRLPGLALTDLQALRLTLQKGPIRTLLEREAERVGGETALLTIGGNPNRSPVSHLATTRQMGLHKTAAVYSRVEREAICTLAESSAVMFLVARLPSLTLSELEILAKCDYKDKQAISDILRVDEPGHAQENRWVQGQLDEWPLANCLKVSARAVGATPDIIEAFQRQPLKRQIEELSGFVAKKWLVEGRLDGECLVLNVPAASDHSSDEQREYDDSDAVVQVLNEQMIDWSSTDDQSGGGNQQHRQGIDLRPISRSHDKQYQLCNGCRKVLEKAVGSKELKSRLMELPVEQLRAAAYGADDDEQLVPTAADLMKEKQELAGNVIQEMKPFCTLRPGFFELTFRSAQAQMAAEAALRHAKWPRPNEDGLAKVELELRKLLEPMKLPLLKIAADNLGIEPRLVKEALAQREQRVALSDLLVKHRTRGVKITEGFPAVGGSASHSLLVGPLGESVLSPHVTTCANTVLREVHLLAATGWQQELSISAHPRHIENHLEEIEEHLEKIELELIAATKDREAQDGGGKTDRVQEAHDTDPAAPETDHMHGHVHKLYKLTNEDEDPAGVLLLTVTGRVVKLLGLPPETPVDVAIDHVRAYFRRYFGYGKAGSSAGEWTALDPEAAYRRALVGLEMLSPAELQAKAVVVMGAAAAQQVVGLLEEHAELDSLPIKTRLAQLEAETGWWRKLSSSEALKRDLELSWWRGFAEEKLDAAVAAAVAGWSKTSSPPASPPQDQPLQMGQLVRELHGRDEDEELHRPFVLVFEAGPLGIGFETETETSETIVVIHDIKSNGQAAGHIEHGKAALRKHTQLLAVGGESIAELPFQDVLQRLASASRPTQITFQNHDNAPVAWGLFDDGGGSLSAEEKVLAGLEMLSLPGLRAKAEQTAGLDQEVVGRAVKSGDWEPVKTLLGTLLTEPVGIGPVTYNRAC